MYTKGKWEVVKSNGFCGEYYKIASDGILAVTCGGDSVSRPSSEQKANAERICHCVNNFDELEKQRDELLEACKYAVTSLKRQEVGIINHEAIENLKRAITNAERILK